jgi:hypothetical protein
MLNFASRELPKQKPLPCRMLNFALRVGSSRSKKNVLLTMLNFASRELPKQKPCYSQLQTLQVESFRSKNRATHKVKLCESGASEAKTLLLTMLNSANRELLKPHSQCYTLRDRSSRSKNGQDFSSGCGLQLPPGNGLSYVLPCFAR